MLYNIIFIRCYLFKYYFNLICYICQKIQYHIGNVGLIYTFDEAQPRALVVLRYQQEKKI